MMLEVLGFAMAAGALAFFSPCGIALVPAYIGFSTTTGRGLRAGIQAGTAAGATAMVLGIIISVTSSAFLATRIQGIGIVLGFLVTVLGVLMMTGNWRGLRIPLPKFKGEVGPGTFGVVFALTGAGCTLPILLAAMAAAAVQGTHVAILAALSYGVALAGMMIAVGAIGGGAGAWMTRVLRGGAKRINQVGGALVSLAGLYVMYYYWTLF